MNYLTRSKGLLEKGGLVSLNATVAEEAHCIFFRKLSFIWRQASTIKLGARLKKRRPRASRLEFPI